MMINPCAIRIFTGEKGDKGERGDNGGPGIKGNFPLNRIKRVNG